MWGVEVGGTLFIKFPTCGTTDIRFTTLSTTDLSLKREIKQIHFQCIILHWKRNKTHAEKRTNIDYINLQGL